MGVASPCFDRASPIAARPKRAGALHGIPFTCKDAIAVAGMRWPNGSRLFADAVADYDVPAIRCMRAVGAILLGKTSVPEFCGFYRLSYSALSASAGRMRAAVQPGTMAIRFAR